MIKYLIEGFLTLTTLLGYWLITHDVITIGAAVAFASNVAWIFYGLPLKSYSLIIVNILFAIININILTLAAM